MRVSRWLKWQHTRIVVSENGRGQALTKTGKDSITHMEEPGEEGLGREKTGGLMILLRLVS